MSFWCSETIKRHLSRIIELPGKDVDPNDVKEAAYELSLGPEGYISGGERKVMLDNDGMVAIAPGEIAVLITEEIVNVDKDTIAFISLKSNVKIRGLVNVSGFHVDPGFKGRLIFTVYNAGTRTCAFTRGQKMFLIWFARLDGCEHQDHKGKRQNELHILGDDITQLTGELASPAKLDRRIKQLELWVKVYGAVVLAFVIAVGALFIREGFGSG